MRSGYGIERLDGGEAGGVHVFAHAAGAGALRLRLTGAILAGEEPGGERAVRDHADALSLAERGELRLVLVAVHEVMVRLERLEAREALRFGDL